MMLPRWRGTPTRPRPAFEHGFRNHEQRLDIARTKAQSSEVCWMRGRSCACPLRPRYVHTEKELGKHETQSGSDLLKVRRFDRGTTRNSTDFWSHSTHRACSITVKQRVPIEEDGRLPALQEGTSTRRNSRCQEGSAAPARARSPDAPQR